MPIQTPKLILLISCLHGCAVFADSFRCGTQLVQAGETKSEVISKCGQPESTDSFCRNEYFQGKFGIEAICHPTDLWVFNRGIGTFLMKVEFEEGKVTTITQGNRVN